MADQSDDNVSFWKQLWYIPGNCNLGELWIVDYKHAMYGNIATLVSYVITANCSRKAIKKLKSNCAPGVNGFQNYSSIQPHLFTYIKMLLQITDSLKARRAV